MSFLTPENYNNAVAFVMAAYALQFLFIPEDSPSLQSH